MTPSEEDNEPRGRNQTERYERIKAWARYVRTHPDDDWGEQVNELVDAQLQSARYFEHNRPDMDELRDSPLLDK